MTNSIVLAFQTALSKLWPLYSLVLLGFMSGRLLNVPREPIAKLLIYIMSPAVIFSGVVKADLGHGHYLLPLYIFALSSVICLSFYKMGGLFLKGATKNILAFGAGNANSGYFAIPVGLSLFGQETLPLFILTNFGFIFYEYTLAFYITARGHHTVRQSIDRVIRLPSIYAFILAIILNLSGYKMPQALDELGQHFRGAYIVLGMMLIGFGVAGIQALKVDWRYLGLALGAKFIVWPLSMFGFLLFDHRVFHLFHTDVYPILFFLSIIPMAANTVAVATELKTEPEKASLAVLLSTLIALVTVPLFTIFFKSLLF